MKWTGEKEKAYNFLCFLEIVGRSGSGLPIGNLRRHS